MTRKKKQRYPQKTRYLSKNYCKVIKNIQPAHQQNRASGPETLKELAVFSKKRQQKAPMNLPDL